MRLYKYAYNLYIYTRIIHNLQTHTNTIMIIFPEAIALQLSIMSKPLRSFQIFIKMFRHTTILVVIIL